MIHLPLKPLIRVPRSYEFVSFDTEGTGAAHGFILAATFDASGAKVFTKPHQLKNYLFQRRFRESRILAANLEYDFAVAFQPFNDNFEIMLVNGKWLQAKYRDSAKHTWVAWDIQRIAPIAVSEMGEIIGLEKYPTPPTLTGHDEKTIEEWHCAEHKRRWCIECYCVRDAEITYKFACMLQSTLNDLGGEMKMTTASCAMDLFRRKFLEDEIAPTWEDANEIARACYYGGRVENYKVGSARGVNVYDFNSLYPSVMRDAEIGLPNTYERVYHPRTPYKYLDKFGQFVGEIQIPSSYIPPLPYRYREKSYYPHGTLKGSWTLNEVANALSHGARICHTEYITYARRTKKIFRRWVDTLYRYRLELKEQNRPDEYVVKIMLNSLYGKFGQHSEGGLQTLIVPRGEYELEDYADCEAVDLAGYECFMRDRSSVVQSPHIHVLWACSITSLARIKLFNKLLSVSEQAFYSDTDSIHTPRILRTSNELGGLKLERTFDKVTYFCPKEYGGITSEGKTYTRVKGIPVSYHEQYLREGYVEFRQPMHTLTAISQHTRIAEWRETVKQRRTNSPTRKHVELADYNAHWVDTAPYPVSELEGLERGVLDSDED